MRMTRLRRSRNWRHTRRTRRQGTEEEDEAGEEQERNQRDKGRTRKRTGNRYRRKNSWGQKKTKQPKYIKEGSTGHPKPRPSKSTLEEERKAKAHERKPRGIPTENPNTSSGKPETGERNDRSRKRRELGQRNTEGH